MYCMYCMYCTSKDILIFKLNLYTYISSSDDFSVEKLLENNERSEYRKGWNVLHKCNFLIRSTVPPDNPRVAQLIKKFRAISRIIVFISTLAQRLS